MDNFGVRTVVIAALLSGATGCGAGSAVAPSPVSPAGPTGLRVISERVRLTGDEVVLSWAGSSTAYRVFIGTTPAGTDVAIADVTGPAYTFVAPANTYYARVAAVSGDRVSNPSETVSFSTVDLRDVIDALLFGTGSLSDNHLSPESAQAAVWPDGTQLRVEIARALVPNVGARARAALDNYAAVVNGAVTATTEAVDDDLSRLESANDLPPFTIAIRSLRGGCGGGGACANFGPAPLGPNASIVTLASEELFYTVEHELGHAYGLSHLRNLKSDIPELQFLMTSGGTATVLSDTEKAAISAARAGGIHAGTTRKQALEAGLVRH